MRRFWNLLQSLSDAGMNGRTEIYLVIVVQDQDRPLGAVEQLLEKAAAEGSHAAQIFRGECRQTGHLNIASAGIGHPKKEEQSRRICVILIQPIPQRINSPR
jgi:hypothetical protein